MTRSVQRHPRFLPGAAPRRVQGMALMESLVASAVLGIALAGATRLSLHTLQTATDTRQHTVANALAQDRLECLHAARTDCTHPTTVTVQGTTYKVQALAQARTGLALVDLHVRVQWSAVAHTPALGTAQAGPNASRQGELVLHSSRDEVPSWLGVSLP